VQAVYEQSASAAESNEGLLPLVAASASDSDSGSGSGSDSGSDSDSDRSGSDNVDADDVPSEAAGPRLIPFDADAETQESSGSNTVSSTAIWNAAERTKSAFGWGSLTLVAGSLVAAVLMGLGLRRRKEVLVPVPVRAPASDSSRLDSPYDPTTWPRG
jgi:hypothetical protein